MSDYIADLAAALGTSHEKAEEIADWLGEKKEGHGRALYFIYSAALARRALAREDWLHHTVLAERSEMPKTQLSYFDAIRPSSWLLAGHRDPEWDLGQLVLFSSPYALSAVAYELEPLISYRIATGQGSVIAWKSDEPAASLLGLMKGKQLVAGNPAEEGEPGPDREAEPEVRRSSRADELEKRRERLVRRREVRRREIDEHLDRSRALGESIERDVERLRSRISQGESGRG